MSVKNWIIVLQERKGEHLRQKCKKHAHYSLPCTQLILGPNGVFYANFRRFGANFKSVTPILGMFTLILGVFTLFSIVMMRFSSAIFVLQKVSWCYFKRFSHV